MLGRQPVGLAVDHTGRADEDTGPLQAGGYGAVETEAAGVGVVEVSGNVGDHDERLKVACDGLGGNDAA